MSDESAREFYFLGAQDPEMDLIVEVLEKRGVRFEFASVNGKRVHPGNAYLADDPAVPPDHTLVYVECGTKSRLPGQVIDHHRPGDPGFSLGPKDYWRASSLGQLVERLGAGVELSAETMTRYLYAAAMDHCFAQAVSGNCPEIDPGRVAAMRVEGIARDKKRTKEEIRTKVDLWRARLDAASTIMMADRAVCDVRERDCGEVYSVDYLCLEQAAAQTGRGCLLRCHDPGSDIAKLVAFGLSPQGVQHFLGSWAPEHQLIRTYGVPDRGYCGGYMTEGILPASTCAA